MDRHPAPTATVEEGTVRVGVSVPAPIERAWLALLDPDRLRLWFGELDAPWQLGQTSRIEFGDGDFFVVTPTEIVTEQLLAFEWRFLGVGPLQQIRWTLTAKPHAAEVVVEDADPARSAAEADQMVAGWTDFMSRLAGYLATGVATRYGWRRDIDGSVDLPEAFRPLRMDTIYRWMPVASDGFKPRWFFIVDDEGPRRFPIEEWHLDLDKKLIFSVAIPDATLDTACTVALEATAGRLSRMRVSHTGWDRLSLPDQRGHALRRRFAAAWVAALDQAKNLASVVDG
jgi:uncharacterized protein YndB with AHSA1/START domain